MTSMSSKAGTRTSTRLRTGLAISALVGAAGAVPTPSNGDGPPFALVVLGVILTIVVIASAAMAWRSGNRLAIRANAAALLLIALTSLPPLFVNVAAWVKVGSAAEIVLTVAALVLTLRPEHQPFTVTD